LLAALFQLLEERDMKANCLIANITNMTTNVMHSITWIMRGEKMEKEDVFLLTIMFGDV
jgi:hypothetical protein